MVNAGFTGIVLCGGGARGALQVGLYQALREAGIHIDFIVGTSVGAINGALMASGLPPHELARLWRGLRRQHLFGYNPGVLLRPFRSDALLRNSGLRRLLKQQLPVRRFEELQTPLTVTGTDLQSGATVQFERGELIPTVMASCAVPGLLEAPLLEGRQIVDGGLSDNLPLDLALARGASTVICMLCACCEQHPQRVRGWLNVLIRSLGAMLDRKLRADIHRLQDCMKLIVMEPRVGLDVGFLDFTHADELISLGYTFALSRLRRENLVADNRAR